MQGKKAYLIFLAIIGAVGLGLICLALIQTHTGAPGPPALQADAEAPYPLRPLPRRAEPGEILFGASISRTGIYEAEGRRVMEGYEFWKEFINTRGGVRVGGHAYPVRILYYDDESDPGKVRENVRTLITVDEIDFLLGPFSSNLTMAASDVSESLGVILVESSGASETIFARNPRYTFAALTSASWYLKDFFSMVSALSPVPRSYGILTMDNLFAKSVAKGARIWGIKSGLQEVYFGTAEGDAANLIPYLEEMAAAKPDITVFCGHYRNAVDFSSQLHAMSHLTPKAVVMTLGPTQKDYAAELGDAAEQMTGITQWVPESGFSCPVFRSSREYARLFEERFGHPPTYQNAQASAACIIFQLALEQCGELRAQEVLAHIRALNAEIFYGIIRFDSRGLNIGHAMAVVQIQNGERRTVWPKEAAQAPFIYPISRAAE